MAEVDADTSAGEKTIRLQVAAARQEESGQGIARMPRSAFQVASAEPSAIRTTTAKCEFLGLPSDHAFIV